MSLSVGLVITFRFLATFYVTALPAVEAIGQISGYKHSVINATIGNVDMIWKGDINMYQDMNLPSKRHGMGESSLAFPRGRVGSGKRFSKNLKGF